MSEYHFHPAVSAWFERHFGQPTEVQALAWPAIQAARNTLISAPTGSGKTLAAFLAAIDQLVREGLAFPLADETHVLYVSPLKALSNDIHKNLELPLNGIRDALLENGYPDVAIRALVRSGDTTSAERAMMKRTPPHILVTTPESLYILLTSDSGREMLRTVRSVIVDEIHALAGNKRGAHLTLSLERLNQLCQRPPLRIGISATQKPIEEMARYLTGQHDDPRQRACTIVDTGHLRQRDLAIELTGSPLQAVMANEAWDEIYRHLEQLILGHRTTLIFVNTRRLAERAAAALAKCLGEEAVTSHHGSLAKEHRLDAEQRLKSGSLRALVATASLELGIDIGDVDLVCQMGSPRSIATFLQRAGRSGHHLSGIPKARLFPLSRDDLVESVAMLDAIRRGELDRIPIPQHPMDVLAQQIIAEVSAREWDEQALYRAFRSAHPYNNLEERDFIDLVKILSEGFHTRRGRRGDYLHRDAVNGVLRPRRSARLTAITNGGAIPDQFDYDVILQPEGLFVGSLNEDFAFESMPGDIFQLGNFSYRMLKIEQGRVFVEDARGLPPTIPFWFGEAPGRTDELSLAVSRLREILDGLLDHGQQAALDYLEQEQQLEPAAASQLVEYLAATKALFGVIPTQKQIVFERFFDATGDMHFIIHAPYGSRINKAWGLALRKRFCRRFNFELQAAANEDNLILSLGPTHSFPLEEPAGYLKANSVERILIQALLAAPMFPTRWRWVANISLAVPRMRGGKRVPAPFQRNDAEDLVALVFPDQLACFENIQGDREVPDHPLVNQVLWDCLHELMDIEGLKRLLVGIERGAVEVTAKDLPTPSPMAQEILNARPYAFLDDTPAEERRALAVEQRRQMDPQTAAEIGRLNPDAIQQVKQEAWPQPRNADELHDALTITGFIAEDEIAAADLDPWRRLLAELQRQQRATRLSMGNEILWVAAERLLAVRSICPDHEMAPVIRALPADEAASRETAVTELIRSRLESLGPVTISQLAKPGGLPVGEVEQALRMLEQEGFVIQGHFDPGRQELEWCERGLLARIHRYTLKRLRSEIEPVSPADFMRFLFNWQGLDEPSQGVVALERVMQQLEGVSLPAASWEEEVLPARLQPYFSTELDQLCGSGKLAWLRRLPADVKESKRKNPAVKATPLAFIFRSNLAFWCQNETDLPQGLSATASKVLEVLKQWGASFFDDLQQQSGLLKTQLESALGELVAWGLVNSDQYQGLRAMIRPEKNRKRSRRRPPLQAPLASGGRWSLIRAPMQQADEAQRVEQIARVLLTRYGVVFRKLLERESGLPSWRELLYCLRRLEARGEIRGGRFVQGFAGEHFALPEAVSLLREVRRRGDAEELVTISSADPLNLTGIITPGRRVAAQAGHRILYRNGKPIANSQAGGITIDDAVPESDHWHIKNLLTRRQHPANYHKSQQGPLF
ncbi:MAG: ATP-dependent DNA helicase [gamma proteobacterium symbiont of Ctena orbiculata]|uniref:DEAD/DEAH box helicase n=1 Tax=Candidatus Thiodiazotropha taylori TaxID=2792791 RepID=A0A944MBC0_9GAMM|nr:DEAD/DEAH box helicase [Candidatus Thiodiazotropha taylori]PUB86281.1 MAG: ATP-dependent DNA helicase [gamma proteobacterium symbiont of Ctena orbiculata]MBT3025550.1 DEAD/DEAH box helicase [Candidatus Thiodiazotropha taylori]MBT3033977.1 DEAD/DEAH box helicase [Candidatus Thiodiazotropha taylori]MBV2135354.1 DEAD/DEAH box helicase [Candidatus Thiodiazotropha taylori]